MDWTQIYLDTFIPELPKIQNNNFAAFKRYMDVFYDENRGILIKPVTTTGLVKGARGEFVTAVVDNLVVRNQFTNLFGNITTADESYYVMLSEPAIVPRDPCTFNIDTPVWNFPYEWPSFKVIDVNKPYYKLSNEYPVQLYNLNLSQIVGFYLDPSMIGASNYSILVDPCLGTIWTADASFSGLYVEFIASGFDASWGTVWEEYKRPAVASSGGGSGAVGPGTINYIPVFNSTNTIGDSSLFMSGSTLNTQEIVIRNAIRDTSGNILLGYGSPMQINDPDANRDVSIYGDVRIDGSLYVNDELMGFYDPTLSDTLEVPTTVGGITAGTTVSQLRGKTYEYIINSLLFPTVLAYIGTAKSLVLSGLSNTTVEVGTAYTPNISSTYNPGLIKNGDDSNGPSLTGNATHWTFTLPNGLVDASISATSNAQSHTFSSYNAIFGNSIWSVTATHAIGTGTYYDNKGNPVTNLNAQRVASSLTTNTGTISGRRALWTGYGAQFSAPTTSAGVRLLSSKMLLSTSNTGSSNINIPAGTQEVYFYVPAGKTILVQYVESSYADVTGSFVQSAISVDDAGETAQTYTSFVSYIGASGYPANATYLVTIS